MSRWFRLYDDTLNDPKILKLSDKTHRVWIGILCVASKNNGELPPFDDMALMLRMKPEKLQPELEKLIAAELIDHDDDGLRPHNWHGRQYKSDVSTDRVKRFRNGKRNVSETPPEQSTEQNIEEPALRAGALTEKASRETKPKRSKARSPLPDDWSLSEVDRAYAVSRGFAETQIETMASAFLNHHQANGNTMASWPAAWRKWCENEIKFSRSKGNGFGGSRPLQDDTLSVGRASERIATEFEQGNVQFPARPSLLPTEGQGNLRLLSKG